MARKQVNFLAKARAKAKDVDVEDWVQTRGEDKNNLISESDKQPVPEEEKMKRLTLDIPGSLHRVIKAKAVAEGVTMADMLRDLFEKTYK